MGPKNFTCCIYNFTAPSENSPVPRLEKTKTPQTATTLCAQDRPRHLYTTLCARKRSLPRINLQVLANKALMAAQIHDPTLAVTSIVPNNKFGNKGHLTVSLGATLCKIQVWVLMVLLKWRAIRPQVTELFPAQLQGDSLSCLPAEDGDADVESVSTPSSDTSAKRADRLAKAIESDSTQGSQAPDPRPCTPCPQRLSPPLFVPWSHVAKLRGIVAVHKDLKACPYEQLQAALAHPKCLVPGEKEQFLQVNSDLLCQLQGSFMPLEGIAPQVFEAIYQRQQGEILWVTILWMIAQLNEYWIGHDLPHYHQYSRSTVVVLGEEP